MSADEFPFRLHQVTQQRPNANQASDRGRLSRAAQGLVVHQALADFHDIQIAVLDFPQLPRFQFVAAFNCFGLHIR